MPKSHSRVLELNGSLERKDLREHQTKIYTTTKEIEGMSSTLLSDAWEILFSSLSRHLVSKALLQYPKSFFIPLQTEQSLLGAMVLGS